MTISNLDFGAKSGVEELCSSAMKVLLCHERQEVKRRRGKRRKRDRKRARRKRTRGRKEVQGSSILCDITTAIYTTAYCLSSWNTL